VSLFKGSRWGFGLQVAHLLKRNKSAIGNDNQREQPHAPTIRLPFKVKSLH